MHIIHIGGAEHHFIEIRILGRELDDCLDYWDGNWLLVECDVGSGAFSGHLKGTLRTNEIADFAEHLEEAYSSLSGSAELGTLEGWLTIRFDFHKKGELWVDGDIIDNPTNGNRLRFQLNLDQSYVPPVLSALRQATAAFPVVGKPPNWLSWSINSMRARHT